MRTVLLWRLGKKKKKGGGIVQRGSDKGSTMLFQKGGWVKLEKTHKDMSTGGWRGCRSTGVIICDLRWAGDGARELFEKSLFYLILIF